MKLLLDTHAILWFATADPQLSPAAGEAIFDPGNEIWVSPVSYWETAIKISVGKYALSLPFNDFWRVAVEGNGFSVLHILVHHAEAVSRLPFPPNHRDPFDRLLVAQALAEGMELVSADPKLDAYGIRRVW